MVEITVMGIAVITQLLEKRERSRYGTLVFHTTSIETNGGAGGVNPQDFEIAVSVPALARFRPGQMVRVVIEPVE